MNIIDRAVDIREDILRLHTLYLEKVEYLNNGEREAFEKYFKHLSSAGSMTGVSCSIGPEIFEDMVNSDKA
jgi:hypothetical protein